MMKINVIVCSTCCDLNPQASYIYNMTIIWDTIAKDQDPMHYPCSSSAKATDQGQSPWLLSKDTQPSTDAGYKGILTKGSGD